MDYKVLYRKYRPKTFVEIVGQEHIVKLLTSSIVSEKTSHAYLFCGPRGTGKTSIAKIFAKALNCDKNKNGSPCLKCSSCLLENNPDVLEIDAASNNGVDEIRELRNNVRIAPSYSKYKVYIVDEVHMLTASAFNALLKTLEEPPSNIVFILATTEIQKVPITILSRCQRLDFKKISDDDIVSHLKKVCKNEEISISKDALNEIAKIADGGLRDALSMLDQFSSKKEEITIDDVLNVTASISYEEIENIDNMIINNDISIIEELLLIENKGIDFVIFANKYINYLKKRIINAIKNESINNKVVIEKKIMSILTNIIINNKKLINGFSLFEVKVLELFDISPSTELPEKPVKKEEMVISSEQQESEQQVIEESVPAEEEKKNVVKENEIDDLEKIKQIRINNCFCEVRKESKEKVQTLWDPFVDYLKEYDLATYALVDCLSIEAASDAYIIFSTRLESQMLLANQKADVIETKLNKKFKTNYKIVVVTTQEWKDIKKDFIANKEKKYELIDESIYHKKNSNKSKIAYEIFDNNKIVIK